ncbi:MAG: putative baseplate assembly protein [Methylocystaceae bacterium]
MLPLPELDDLYFQDIVEDARKMIPQLFSGWTDENYHDPGITLIEMLAWLTEMQQYYLNQITDRNELKFLKLLGIKPGGTESARTDVTFSDVHRMMSLPTGSQLAASDQIFETTESLTLLPYHIDRVLVYSEKDYRDFTSFNETGGLFYYAFGRNAQKGNRLLIGLDQALPTGLELCLAIHLFESYPIKPGPTKDQENDFVPPARISWSYYGWNGWKPLNIMLDESLHFNRSGRIKFVIPDAMEAAAIGPAADQQRFWLSCCLEDDVLELSPRIEDICFNTVPVKQQATLSEVKEFSSSGLMNMQFKADSSLAVYGNNELQVRNTSGNWVFWDEVIDFSQSNADDRVFLLKPNGNQELIIQFGDNHKGMIPPAGSNNIRLISYQPGFKEQRWLGQSNGLPGQSFDLPGSPLLESDLILQVGKRSPVCGEILWQDWKAVDDFTASSSFDRHYIVDAEQSLICFGNNENGIIPDRADEPNLLVLGYKIGGGLRGNVKEHEINKLISDEAELASLGVGNRRPAYGGTARETIAEAKQRLKAERQSPHRAVTADDFEILALQTPGLRVARVKAVPLYKPGLKNYPDRTAEAQVTVAVMPYSENLTPLPSTGFRETVLRHLNRHRLLTTEVHVVDPDYVRVSVSAVVVVASGTVRGQRKIVQELNRFLQPLDRDDWSRGWPFGRTVYRGDIYEVINNIPGVEYVKELWLIAEGSGIRRELSGDVELPPCGLVYPGDHEIEIINRKDL